MYKSLHSFLSNRESRAVGMVFMALAVIFGAWVTRLPEIKERLNLDEGQLGLALFFMPLGATVLLPFYSKIIQRIGERRSTLLGILSFLVAIILPIAARTYVELIIGLFVVGLSMGMTDVAMNAVAVEVENQKKRIIMSTCHGFFSIGGMIGAATASIFIALGANALVHIGLWSVVLAIMVLVVAKDLLNSDEQHAEAHVFRFPPKSILGLALIGFCIMLSEGAITDWSTIYLKDNLDAPATLSGLGFAGFAGLMALGRFFGDNLIQKYGNRLLVLIGCVLSIAGLLILQIDHYGFAIAGLSVAGLGFSVIVPILFSSAAKQPGVKASVGIASVASSGYIGLLMGPVIIGFVADRWGLKNGFLFLAILTAIALVLTAFLIKKR
ncbi:MAG: MFS family permease [Roseivirga sp.]|jgi:MFS family permease